MTSVVILSGRSLFAEGIARRLGQYLDFVQLEIVDPRRQDVMAWLQASQPSVVILDATDAEVTQLCPLTRLLLSIPQLRVICLDPQRDEIQVVTGETRKAVEVRDLVAVIEQVEP